MSNVQPIARFQGQATDVDLARKEIKNVKAELVTILQYFLYVLRKANCVLNALNYFLHELGEYHVSSLSLSGTLIPS